jgi:hypothetical protein
LERSKYFIPLLGFSALFVAFNAAFFSVFGLSKLFAGAMLSVIVMASSLELAKLVTAAYLYRYWGKINRFMKSYLLIGVVTLILITSAGIFGFLSNAYQGATVDFEKQSTALLYKEDRLEQLADDKEYLKEELDAAISELPENYRTAKRQLREEYQPKINQINIDMMELKGEIGDLKVELVETGVDVGPAIYLARAFDTDVDTVVKFFIFILIFVFDPLAVCLVVAYQTALVGGASWRYWEVYGEDEDDKSLIDTMFSKYKDKKKKVQIPEDEPSEGKVKAVEYKSFEGLDSEQVMSKGGRRPA